MFVLRKHFFDSLRKGELTFVLRVVSVSLCSRNRGKYCKEMISKRSIGLLMHYVATLLGKLRACFPKRLPHSSLQDKARM